MTRSARSQALRPRFYYACIPTRLLFFVAALCVAIANNNRVHWSTIVFGVAGFVFVAGLCVSALAGRTHGFAGGAVWWTNYRVIHVALWSTYATLMLTTASPWSAGPLLLDVLFAVCFEVLAPNDQLQPSVCPRWGLQASLRPAALLSRGIDREVCVKLFKPLKSLWESRGLACSRVRLHVHSL